MYKILNLLKFIKQKGFFHLLSANFLIQFLGFGSQIIVAKFLTPTDMGNIKVIQSYTAVLTVLASFGFNTAVLKMCSEQIEDSIKNSILKKAFFYSAITSILTLLGFTFVVLSFNVMPQIKLWGIIYALSIPALVYTALIMQYFQALKQIIMISKIQSFLKILSVAGIVSITYFFRFEGYIISTVIFFYIGLIPLIKTIKLKSFKEKNFSDSSDNILKKLFYYALFSVLTLFVSTLTANSDIFLLNHLLKDKVQLGNYSIATIFVLGLNQITGTVQAICTPYFSEKGENKKQFLRMLFKYQKLMIVLAIILTMVTILIVPFVIKLIFGTKYMFAGNYYRVLVWRFCFWSFYAIVNVALIGIGMVKYSFYANAGGLLISLSLGYILIQKLGTIGAAYSQAITMGIMVIIVIFTTKLAINKKFGKESVNET